MACSFIGGLYAVHARGEWYASMERVPPEEYDRAFGAFDAADYDPRAWARMARQAGMKYAVLTAKHHEGFCLFDSAYTDYKATNTPAGRDLVREYLEAFRAEGLRVGLYYSLVDCVSKGGTYLLNVGPNARGALPAPAQEILREIGAAANYPGYTFLSLAARANETQPLPDAADTVVKLELR